MRWSRAPPSGSFRKTASWSWISSSSSPWLTPCPAVCAPPSKANCALLAARWFQPSMFFGRRSVKSCHNAAGLPGFFPLPRISLRRGSPAALPASQSGFFLGLTLSSVSILWLRSPLFARAAWTGREIMLSFFSTGMIGQFNRRRIRLTIQRSVRSAHTNTVRPIYKGVKWLGRIISTHATF